MTTQNEPWTLNKVQLEMLLCAKYDDIFKQAKGKKNGLSVLADENRGPQRYDAILKVIKDTAPYFQWPPHVRLNVYDYERDERRDHGILLGPNELIFSWPQNTDYQYQGSNLPKLKTRLESLLAANYVKGRAIYDVFEAFREKIYNPALEKGTLSSIDENNPSAVRQALNAALKELQKPPVPTKSVPDNLDIALDASTAQYRIEYNPNGNLYKWTLVLPLGEPPDSEDGDPSAPKPECDPPCDQTGKY